MGQKHDHGITTESRDYPGGPRRFVVADLLNISRVLQRIPGADAIAFCNRHGARFLRTLGFEPDEVPDTNTTIVTDEPAETSTEQVSTEAVAQTSDVPTGEAAAELRTIREETREMMVEIRRLVAHCNATREAPQETDQVKIERAKAEQELEKRKAEEARLEIARETTKRAQMKADVIKQIGD